MDVRRGGEAIDLAHAPAYAALRVDDAATTAAAVFPRVEEKSSPDHPACNPSARAAEACDHTGVSARHTFAIAQP